MLRKIIAVFSFLSFCYTVHSQTCDAGSAITATRVNTLATCTNVASLVPAFSGSTPGLVPASLGGTTNFLRSDGTWVAPSGTGMVYPSAGIPLSTGTAWGTSYGTTGTGSVALSASPTFTGTLGFTNASGSNVTSANFTGIFGGIYGSFVLGSGYGAQVEKTVSDETPVIIASENTATTGTGDYYDTKDSSGSIHTIVDHSMGIHGVSGLFGSSGQLSIDSSGNLGIGYTGTLPIPFPFTVGSSGQFHSDASGHVTASTFNGVGLTTSGPSTSCLSEAGTYVACSNSSSGFPVTIGSTSISANSITSALAGLSSLGISGNTTIANPSPSTPDSNASSGVLTFLGNFWDIGTTPDSWMMQSVLGTGNTPTSTLTISKVAGGTTGSETFQVISPNTLLGGNSGGAGELQLSSNSALLGNNNGSGITVGSSSVTVNSSGPINLYPATGNSVILDSPISARSFVAFNGGSEITLAPPAGGSGNFTSNLTAENGDLDVCPTGTPTIVIGPAAGTSATSNLFGDNCGGVVTITTGSNTVSQNAIFTLNFSSPFTHYGFCTFSPMRVTLQDPGITTDSVYMDTGYTDHFELGLSGTGVMSVLSNHQWSYTCNGY